MTFTYNIEAGLTTDVEKIRLMTGDVVEDDALMQDEEIQFYIDNEPNIWWAAAQTAIAMVARLQGHMFEDQKVGETRLRARRIDELKRFVEMWKQRGATHMLPSAGGIYQDETDNMLSNSNIRKGTFYKGMHDSRGTLQRNKPLTKTDEEF